MRFVRSVFIYALVIMSLLGFTSSQAEVVHIAVAANFTHTMKELITTFEKQSPHQVKASYASSGKIYAQITHGAPFDIFFSADQLKPSLLFDDGLTHSKPFTYALGSLALWSNNNRFKGMDLKHKLQKGEFNKLAIANPKLAPYGAAAIDVLNHLNLVEATQKKWVKGENIAQTYQYVATGNADLGFIALSQVIHQTAISSKDYWSIPANLYQPIQQDAVLLTDNNAARDFIKFLSLPKSQEIIQSYGYQTRNKIDSKDSNKKI